MLEKIYAITINGLTSMNTLSARLVFVKTPAGKARLAMSLKPAIITKMTDAQVIAVMAHDMDFWKELPFLFLHKTRCHMFDCNAAYCADRACRNGTLYGAYFMFASRVLGLDVFAISRFSNAVGDEKFFAATPF